MNEEQQRLAHLTELFEAQAGGQFIVSADECRRRLQNIKAFVFDWDGVFNDGSKTGDSGSAFSEPDSMGINLLRFGYWLQHGSLPYTAIITGEQNPSAVGFCKREHFNAIYFKTRNKAAALEHLLRHFRITAEQVAYCFDDVLDLPIATVCGLRFTVRRRASVLFNEFVTQRRLSDYISGREGGNHAVREICELMLGLMKQFDNAVIKRSEYGPDYRDYLESRNEVQSLPFTYSETSHTILTVEE